MVTITNQSFRDSGGLDVFPNLHIGRIIYGNVIFAEGQREAMARADIALEDIANVRRLTHVFEVKHQLDIDDRPGPGKYSCFAYGTGYSESTE